MVTNNDKRLEYKQTINEVKLWYYANKADNEKKIYVPRAMRAAMIRWYHHNLGHPGITRNIQTIHQFFMWPNLAQDVGNYVKKCRKCQQYKTTATRSYAELPADNRARTTPWYCIHVDLIGPW